MSLPPTLPPQIHVTTKNENLKATAASTLARLLRHNPALVSFIVDKIGVRTFVAGLSDSSSKVRRVAKCGGQPGGMGRVN